MKKYLIVAEKTETGYSAFSPDLPGCVATGRNRAELEIAMREAVLFHLDGLKEDHEEIPAPRSYCTVFRPVRAKAASHGIPLAAALQIRSPYLRSIGIEINCSF